MLSVLAIINPQCLSLHVQVRKRLKGHGFGVRKVESADRKQAVIIHTATGQHLRELEALLADVMSSTSKERPHD